MISTKETVAHPIQNPVPVVAAPAPMRRGKVLAILAVLSTLLILGLVLGFIPKVHRRAALQTQRQELAVPTFNLVAPAPSSSTGNLVLPAEVKAFTEAAIYARASGYVKRWLADIGTPVEAGQLLAEIDTPELNQELARARAELAQAEASLDLAKKTAGRWAELLKTASVSEQEAAERQSDLALKSATVDAAQANVRRLEDLQSFQHVTAPFAGTITARNIDVGELIPTGGAKVLFRLEQTRPLRVYVHVPQSAARAVTIGGSAEITIPELPGRTFTAKVVRTSGTMNPVSRTLLTELEMDNSKGEILAGSYAQAKFKDTRADAVLTLPSNTLLFRAEGPQVGVVGPDNKVDLRKIVLGRDFGTVFEVLEGITAADRVIVNPSDALVSGTMVRIGEKVSSAAK